MNVLFLLWIVFEVHSKLDKKKTLSQCNDYKKYAFAIHQKYDGYETHMFQEKHGWCTVVYCFEKVMLKDYYPFKCEKVLFESTPKKVEDLTEGSIRDNFCRRTRTDVYGTSRRKKSCIILRANFTDLQDFNMAESGKLVEYMDFYHPGRDLNLFRELYMIRENYTEMIADFSTQLVDPYVGCMYSNIREMLYDNQFTLSFYTENDTIIDFPVPKYDSLNCINKIRFGLKEFLDVEDPKEFRNNILMGRFESISPSIFFESKLPAKHVSRMIGGYFYVLRDAIGKYDYYENSILTSVLLILERAIYLGKNDKIEYLFTENLQLTYFSTIVFGRSFEKNISCRSFHQISVVSDRFAYVSIACVKRYDDKRYELVMVESPYDSIKMFSVSWKVDRKPKVFEKYICNFLSGDTGVWSDFHCKAYFTKNKGDLEVTCKCPFSGYVTTSIRRNYEIIFSVVISIFFVLIPFLFIGLIRFNFVTGVYRSKYQNRHVQIKLAILIFYFLAKTVKISVYDSNRLCLAVSTFMFLLFFAYSIVNLVNAFFYLKIKAFTGLKKEVIPLALTSGIPLIITLMIILYRNDYFVPVKGCFGSRTGFYGMFVSLNSFSLIVYAASFANLRRLKLRRTTSIVQTVVAIMMDIFGLVYSLNGSIVFIAVEGLLSLLFGFTVFGTEMMATLDERATAIDVDDFRNLRGYD